MSEDGSPAFPFLNPETEVNRPYPWEGMSLRDYFAAHALAALVGGRSWDHEKKDGSDLMSLWAKSAYGLADAMLKARVTQTIG